MVHPVYSLLCIRNVDKQDGFQKSWMSLMCGSQGPVQLVKTKRPYTPRERERRLYSTSNHRQGVTWSFESYFGPLMDSQKHSKSGFRKHSGFGHKGNGGLKLDTLPELTTEKVGSATSRSSGSSTSSILDTKLPGNQFNRKSCDRYCIHIFGCSNSISFITIFNSRQILTDIWSIFFSRI